MGKLAPVTVPCTLELGLVTGPPSSLVGNTVFVKVGLSGSGRILLEDGTELMRWTSDSDLGEAFRTVNNGEG